MREYSDSHRLRRVVWACVIVALLATAGAIATRVWNVVYVDSDGHVRLIVFGGELVLTNSCNLDAPPLEPGWHTFSDREAARDTRLLFALAHSGWRINLPLITIAGVAVIVALAARSVPRSPDRSCAGCGYDLRGNTSGRCPECGRDCPKPKRTE
jgi:hypothetical protein